jgi:hypothetical protein
MNWAVLISRAAFGMIAWVPQATVLPFLAPGGLVLLRRRIESTLILCFNREHLAEKDEQLLAREWQD